MSSTEWAQAALQSFDAVVSATEGFRSRPGQRLMAEQVARTFSRATLGKVDEESGEPAPTRSIAVIQAGTGVGKSLAYCAPAIALALARGTRVLISTATVALQEQLVNKDLPALAALMPQPFKFALAKGRGRYVCKLKLDRLAGHGEAQEEGEDDLFAEEEAAARAKRPRHETEARIQFYSTMAQTLAKGAWDGDRDSLDTPPEPEVWSPVAAEGASCTGKHCPAFSQCTYYDKRKELVGAQVIVANHDLLLSSLGARVLPELDNCLLVLDEAHHLPSTALDQFACSMDLSRITWIERLASRGLRIGALLEVEEIADIPKHSAQLRQTLQDLARIVMDVYGEQLKGFSGRIERQVGAADRDGLQGAKHSHSGRYGEHLQRGRPPEPADAHGARIRAEPPSLARLQLHRLALAVEGQVGIDHATANGFDHAVQLCIDLGIAGLFMEHPAQGGDKDQRPGLGQGGLQGVRLFQQGGKRGNFCRLFVHAQQRLQRAALGLLKAALALGGGPGEGAFFVAKQGGLKQTIRNGGTVNRNKRSIATCGMVVDVACDDLFANTAFTGQQHRCIGLRNARCQRKKITAHWICRNHPIIIQRFGQTITRYVLQQHLGLKRLEQKVASA